MGIKIPPQIEKLKFTLPVVLPLIVLLLGGFQLYRYMDDYPGPVLLGEDAGSWAVTTQLITDRQRVHPVLPSRALMLPVMVALSSELFGDESLVTAAHRVNVVFSLLALLLLYLLATRMFGVTVGFIAAAFGTFMVPWVEYIWQFNAESLVIPMSLLAWLLGWWALERKSKVSAWLAGLGFTLFFFTHLMSVGYMILFLGLVLVWPGLGFRWRATLLFHTLLGFAVSLVGLAALGIHMLNAAPRYFLTGFEQFFFLVIQTDIWGVGHGGGGGSPGPGPHGAQYGNLSEYLGYVSHNANAFFGQMPKLIPSGGPVLSMVVMVPLMVLGVLGLGGKGASEPASKAPRRWWGLFHFRRSHLYAIVFMLPILGHIFVRPIPHYFSPLYSMIAVTFCLGLANVFRLATRKVDDPDLRRKIGIGAVAVFAAYAVFLQTMPLLSSKIPTKAHFEMRVGSWVGAHVPADATFYSNTLEVCFHANRFTVPIPQDNYVVQGIQRAKDADHFGRNLHVPQYHDPLVDHKISISHLLVDTRNQRLNDSLNHMRSIVEGDPSRHGLDEVKRWEGVEGGEIILFELDP